MGLQSLFTVSGKDKKWLNSRERRPCGKESIEIWITQNMGKQTENLTKNEEISRGKANTNKRKLIRNISTITDVFLNQKRVNVCEHT